MFNQGMFTPAVGSGVVAVGRAKKSGTTYYTIPGCLVTDGSTGTNTVNTDHYSFWYTPTQIVIDQLAAEVTTLQASQNFRIGFYAADTDWQPTGAPLADSGDISTGTTGVKTYTPGSAITVPAGRYVSVINTNASTAAFRFWRAPFPNMAETTALGTAGQLVLTTVARTYAAFPTPGTVWDTVVPTNAFPNHWIFYRVSTP